ncbi:Folic acid synthesis protein fol1 [Hypsizygus marmoreus]|uniref:dihydroneopterin aldolase n=1 Tax=Hypsizygus marmoreus TaxID=39966 RepID=A0A369JEV2_HYPMA|nr:Folic acid synthesis protein fol1 [Hypsizygus marmoreus]
MSSALQVGASGNPPTDIVFIDSLHLSADVGLDCWKRSRPQPIEISVYLHLRSAFLTTAGRSDDVLDSVHYGHLSKAIITLVEKKPGSSFGSINGLVAAVADEAFGLAGSAAVEVRIVVGLPKQILLAGGFSVDVIVPRDRTAIPLLRKVSITDLVLPVLIGVNPPEREAKQRVITNIMFVERQGDHQPIDYPEVVAKIIENIDASAYLTLEKFVLEIVRAGCLSSEYIEAVTVRSQKPSALSYAHSSGVEITRQRAEFIGPRH